MIRKIVNHFHNEGLKGLIRITKNYIRDVLTPFYMRMLETIRKPERKIVFCNFAGRGYGGYPKEICDELIRRKVNVRLIWLVKENANLPDQVQKVQLCSYKALKELATAKIWIDNCRKDRRIRKGKGTFYLQMWHGGGPCLKKIEGDAVEYLSRAYLKDARNDSAMADLFISDCEWQNENYRRAFWYQGEILNCTTPPNDFFYQDWADIRRSVFEFFKIKGTKHIILYAPTFRNNHTTSCYDIDYQRILEICKNRFGGEWTFIVRIHPTMVEQQFQIQFGESVINGTTYPQIEELLIASEILITDFSASMFLAYRWKIKTFLYAKDLEEYIRNERPLYFDIKDLPAGFSKTNDELEQMIMGFSEEDYNMKCERFSKSVGYFSGGRSVKTITDRIENVLNQYSAN